MFFIFGPKIDNEKFSWAICKNPTSVFKEENPYGNIIGQFINSHIFGKKYALSINCNKKMFAKHMRETNASNYIHEDMHSVNSAALKGIDIAFKSTIRGKNAESLEVCDYEAYIGPFVTTGRKCKNYMAEFFIEAGFQYEIFEDFGDATVIKLSSSMSLKEFIQKIYIISSVFSSTSDFVIKNSKDEAKKYLNFSFDWINSMSDDFKKILANKISGKNIDLKKFLNESLSVKEEKEKYDSFHDKRHNLILRYVSSCDAPKNPRVILDLGCGATGYLSRQIAKEFSSTTKIIGIDAYISEHFQSKVPKNVHLIRGDFVTPNIMLSDMLNCDIVVMSESLEHIELHERNEIINLIAYGIIPKRVIITVPNVEYNKYFNTLYPNGYRHHDHRIEYTRELIANEIESVMSENYDICVSEILVNDEGVGPSFIIVADKKAEVNIKKQNSFIQKNIHLVSPMYLEETNYNVEEKTMLSGMGNSAYLRTKNSLFAIGSTIAPCEYTQKFPDYLEHPYSAFNYFKEKGVRYIVEEEKEMGSRMLALVFRNEDIAKKFNSEKFVFLSKKGVPFFNKENSKNKDFCDMLYKDITSKMDTDFIIFDGEFRPWAFKTDNLIRFKFIMPGQIAYLDRKYNPYDSGDIKNVEKYFKVVDHFSQKDELTYHPFSILAMGNIDDLGNIDKKRLKTMQTMSLQEQNNVIHNFVSDIIKQVSQSVIDLDNEVEIEKAIQRWHESNNYGSEGKVYKPLNLFDQNGFLNAIPAIKVRTKNYLRIVYGFDYIENIDMLSKRKINTKRMVSIHQTVIVKKLLHAFLSKNLYNQKRCAAAFFGIDSLFKIDATL